MFTDLLNVFADVYSKSIVQNPSGSVQELFTIRGTYPARITHVKDATRTVNNIVTTVTEYKMFFEITANISINDRVDYGGTVYEVKDIRVVHDSEQPHHLEVLCIKFEA